MGSVQYHSPARRWYIKIQGERLWRDCDAFQPFLSKKQAIKYLGIAQQQIDSGEFDPQYWRPDSPVLIKNVAARWVESHEASKKTLMDYRGHVKNYIIPYLGNKDVRKVKAGILDDFYKHLRESSGDELAWKVMSTFRTMLRELYRREEIFRVPPFPILSRPSVKKAIPYLTLDQQETILNAIPERHRGIYAFGMEYGLRVQEVRALMWDCVKDGKVTIKRAFSENELKGTKTNEERIFDITSTARDVLDRVKRHTSTTFIFVREDGRPYTNKNINEIWHKSERGSDIYCKLQNAMRHSLGCQLLDQGVSENQVRQILGHTTFLMTKRYAQNSTGVLGNVLENRRKVVELKMKREGSGE